MKLIVHNHSYKKETRQHFLFTVEISVLQTPFGDKILAAVEKVMIYRVYPYYKVLLKEKLYGCFKEVISLQRASLQRLHYIIILLRKNIF
jgi:hypothetical protein